MEQTRVTPLKKRGRPKAQPNAICTQCGKPFHRSPSQQRTKLLFCSHKCSGQYYGTAHINTPEMRKQRSINMTGSNNPRWVGGEIFVRGQKLIRNPSHPRAWANGYIPEKYLIIEKLINRPLARNANYHLQDTGDSLILTMYQGHRMNGWNNAKILGTKEFPKTLLNSPPLPPKPKTGIIGLVPPQHRTGIIGGKNQNHRTGIIGGKNQNHRTGIIGGKNQNHKTGIIGLN